MNSGDRCKITPWKLLESMCHAKNQREQMSGYLMTGRKFRKIEYNSIIDHFSDSIHIDAQ